MMDEGERSREPAITEPRDDDGMPQARDGELPGTGPAEATDSQPKAAVPGDGTSEASAADGKGQGSGQRPLKKSRSFWRELPVLIAVALVLALVIKTYAVQAYFIPSSSMENTLEIGDKVLVNKIVYDIRGIHRGDVVVFNGEGSWDLGSPQPQPSVISRFFRGIVGLFGAAPGEHDYIKRVIGLPGDHVACCDAQGRLTVNGVPLNEPTYLFPGDSPSTVRFTFTVPSGHLWVMGDHRSISYDSRGHMGDPGGGSIPENEVVGRAFVIIWPVSRWRIVPIPATFQQPKLTGAQAPASGSGQAARSAPAALSAPVAPAGPVLPLALGFAGAIPLTWLQRRLRKGSHRRGAA
jgi:signal peptidase I